jgi:large repetitive protein
LWLASAAAMLAPAVHAASIDHFSPSSGPHNFIDTPDADVLPHLDPAVFLLGSYAKDPFVYRDDAGAEVAKIVEHAATADLVIALGLFNNFELSLSLPGSFLVGPGFDGRASTADDINNVVIADPRLAGRWRFLGDGRNGLQAMAHVGVDFPLAQAFGTSGRVLGDKLPTVAPGIAVAYHHPAFKVGANVAAELRAPDSVGDVRNQLTIGQSLQFGLGAQAWLYQDLIAAVGDIQLHAAPAALLSSENQFPAEAQLGVKAFFGPIAVLVGVGTGLIADYGSPDLRLFAGVGYYNPPARDADGDGIYDNVDQCPNEPEDKDGHRDEDGCPDPDNDGDGILDGADKCPDEPETKNGVNDEDGCPDEGEMPVDTDGDGIFDAKDACPTDPEDKDGWLDDDGCPEPDNDGDGILDGADKCPNDPESKNDYEDEDGCPDEAPKKTVIRVTRERLEIRDKVQFEFNSDVIRAVSFQMLDDVAKVLAEHPEQKLIHIDGHSSAEGAEEYNRKLSQRRAESVRQYLIKRKVAAGRLEAHGFGESRPITADRSDAGLAMNRRVEFRLVDVADDSQPAAEVKP